MSVAVILGLKITGMNWFPKPTQRIKNKTNDGKFKTNNNESSEIFQGQCTSDFPFHRFRRIHIQYQMIALGIAVIDLCYQFGRSKAC